ncbi:prefoldin subunit protein [Toxoplasma gondii TgCatPRC2]|uniref:Prefoldin subunit 2 n=15 Tax=Toxoplasma gondii TaxID=5811 RepID=A0A0F7UTS9_TOXGV|nr:prefoldin subunit protein [Toxoplasma gondii ME49]EPR57625.1 prefoldin subunit protein [Toxoplasma gondii GT1]ESS29254.1 prefoldin subunit protein [Toxoplasma gondii VEG]KAF4646101.1 prefoldin subunit protein [Toxoplasma gondii]KFG31888.1 prefoldin subunit protein [Toxoplasma gondii GAB2-2007-GAL-DOM2]KFG35675.1 prefoldin subunit protein [Toxoplasma gondii p89]KFG47122.1 prefoldin subunit protein [Toxoplasma gondii FOU]KFG59463.1 prefoldin subunit protein [Toxoplasma gondii RUB]KFH03277.|eukprot:XP_002370160.1 prefoldin subunit protein [Toxoplasma gondii ME49]
MALAAASSASASSDQKREDGAGAAGLAELEKKEWTVPELQQALHRVEREKVILVSKIQDLQQDTSEHRLVLDAFAKVNADRRCYRMVGGVLVQRTVGEVKPALEEHKQKVDATLELLEKNLETLLATHSLYTRKYLQLTGQAAPAAGKDAAPASKVADDKEVSGSSGILV